MGETRLDVTVLARLPVTTRRSPGGRRASPDRVDDLAVAEEVALADRHAVVAQDRVGGRVVEVEVRGHEIQQVVLASEVERRVRKLDLDRALLGAFELLRLEG